MDGDGDGELSLCIISSDCLVFPFFLLNEAKARRYVHTYIHTYIYVDVNYGCAKHVSASFFQLFLTEQQ